MRRHEATAGGERRVTVPGMTSTTNARELDRLRKARTDAQDRFAKQMKLLEQIVATAAEREAIIKRWHGQLAALSDLSGGVASAAELSGLPKSDIETAVKSVDRADVEAVLEAAKPAPRRRRKPANDAGASGTANGSAGSAAAAASSP